MSVTDKNKNSESLPLLSIVTPSYNQAKYIEHNLQSVKNQSYPNVEHIVVDGGSDDGTVDILKTYEDEYNLRWVSEPDRGQSHAINKGIRMANGEWIGWQNSDDYYTPSAFEGFHARLKANPDADLIYGDLIVVNEEREEINRIFTIPRSKFVCRNWSTYTSNQCTFIRASVFERVGMLNEKIELTMDTDLFYRMAQQEVRAEHVSDFFGVFRVQPDAKTMQDVEEEINAERQLMYDRPTYEKMLPRPLRQNLAKLLKAAYLLRERRWYAFEYNLRKAWSRTNL